MNVNTQWVKEFLAHKEYGHFTFKKLNNAYPFFDFPKDLIKTVDEEDFIKQEKNVLPVFLATSIGGTFPYKMEENIKLFRGQLVAVLNKNLLSGGMYELSICKVKYNSKYVQKSFVNRIP